MPNMIITRKRMVGKTTGTVLEVGTYPIEEHHRTKFMVYDKSTGKHWFVDKHKCHAVKMVGGEANV